MPATRAPSARFRPVWRCGDDNSCIVSPIISASDWHICRNVKDRYSISARPKATCLSSIVLVAQPNGKPAVQQRVFCVFGGRPSRLGRGGFVRSFSEAPGFRFRGGEVLDGSVFGADRTVCSVCGAGAFRRLRPCRALRLRGGGGLWTVPFWRRALPCGSVFGADRAMRSVRGAGRLRTAPFLEVPGFRFRCGDALDVSFSGQAVPCVSFAVWRSFRRLCPCRAAKRRNGGRRVGR